MGLEGDIKKLFIELDRINARLNHIEYELTISETSEFEIVKRQISKINSTIFDSKYENTGLTYKLQ